MSLFSSAFAAMGGAMKTVDGRTVTIRQGARAPLSLTGWLDKHDYEVVSAEGLLTLVRSYDWTFVATDLGTLELREGAEIKETVNGSVVGRYEVMPVAGKPGIEDLDSSGVLKLVHTKKVS